MASLSDDFLTDPRHWNRMGGEQPKFTAFNGNRTSHIIEKFTPLGNQCPWFHSRLLPLYDMCSMGFASKSGGEVRPFAFVPPEFKAFSIGKDLMDTVKKAARDFWENVAGDERISDEFKEYLQKGNPAGRI